MSKAVLVLDEMPENCADCRLEDSEYHICKPTYKDVPRISLFEPERPGYCPLRPIPEKYNSSYDTDYGVGYVRGWNDCLNQILQYFLPEGEIDRKNHGASRKTKAPSCHRKELHET